MFHLSVKTGNALEADEMWLVKSERTMNTFSTGSTFQIILG